MNASVVNEPGWGGWALDRHAALELAAFLDRAQPRTIVESGSGMSTVLLAEYASRTGASVTSLEHLDRYANITRTALHRRGLADWVDLRVAPLADILTPWGPLAWYDTGLPDGVDFALVDGPPGKVGRRAALPALLPHMTGGRWEIWLDDAARDGEQACLNAWQQHYPLRMELVGSVKGLARIVSSYAPARPLLDASDVTVTLLTGDRPDLLSATVDSVQTLAPGLLDSAWVAVLHNGGDPDTAAVLDRYPWIDHRAVLPSRLPIAEAAQALLGFPPPRKYVLHLEDDWQVCTTDPSWLDRARAVLADDAGVHQVRLRHHAEPVLKEHMLTRRPLLWAQGAHGTLNAAAHYTLNPSLMRSDQVPLLWPAADERGAQKAFYNLGWRVAQMVPGVFRHIGGGASLRLGERP